MRIKNKKRLAVEIVLVVVIIYLWQSRYRKKTIEQAKLGADIAPSSDKTSDNILPNKMGDCGELQKDSSGAEKATQGQISRTLTVVQ